MTGSLEIFARLPELNVGDAVKLDAGFDCGIAGKTLVVDEDDRGLFVACDEGRHYLDGQLADDGDHLVGVYRVEGETVEAVRRVPANAISVSPAGLGSIETAGGND